MQAQEEWRPRRGQGAHPTGDVEGERLGAGSPDVCHHSLQGREPRRKRTPTKARGMTKASRARKKHQRWSPRSATHEGVQAERETYIEGIRREGTATIAS